MGSKTGRGRRRKSGRVVRGGDCVRNKAEKEKETIHRQCLGVVFAFLDKIKNDSEREELWPD